MITKIKNGRLILKGGIDDEKSLYIKDSRILAITEEELLFDKEIDANGAYVSPGFIDIHTHGGGGYDFMDGGIEPIIKACAMHMKYGTTSILPTTLACSNETLLDFLKDLKSVMDEGQSKIRILGTHLEGPYFADSQRGAQPPEYIKAPKKAEYEDIIKRYGDIIRRWSFAPELDGSVEFCKTLKENKILPSIAHSDAVLEEIEPVYDAGCRMVTHLYSGMSSITRKGGFRHLGVVETTYLYDDMNAEIIADGCHLPGPLLKLIVKQLGTDRICLVTDSMRGAGMPEGESLLGRVGEGLPCIIEDGVAKMMDKSGFAGSVATADRLVRTMVKEAGCSVADAVKMVTENPAKILGVDDIGELKTDNFADIVIFDDDINIKCVIANGEPFVM